MAIYWPTPGLKGRMFKLCVLTRWDFNFCVHSSPLPVTYEGTGLWNSALERGPVLVQSFIDMEIWWDGFKKQTKKPSQNRGGLSTGRSSIKVFTVLSNQLQQRQTDGTPSKSLSRVPGKLCQKRGGLSSGRSGFSVLSNQLWQKQTDSAPSSHWIVYQGRVSEKAVLKRGVKSEACPAVTE